VTIYAFKSQHFFFFFHIILLNFKSSNPVICTILVQFNQLRSIWSISVFSV